jgi:DHA2 family methylenomycin A resistance protein-like MFS transporter
MLLPMVLALVGKSFSDTRARVQAVNLITLFGGAGWAIGPSIGGLLTSTVGWRAVFWLTVPVAIAAALLVKPRTNERGQRRTERFDIAGQITGTAGLTLLVAGLIELGHDASLFLTGGLLVCGTVSLAAFVAVQRRSGHPMMPLGVFAIPAFRRSVMGGFIFQFSAYGLSFYLAVYLQHAWAINAELGGILLISFAAGIISASLFINPHVQGGGPRRMILIGTLVATPATLALLFATSSARWPVLVIALLFVGAGSGIYSTGLNQVAGQALGSASAGLASGIYNTSRQIGMSIGIAVLGALVALPDLRLGYVIAITAATVGVASIGMMELRTVD